MTMVVLALALALIALPEVAARLGDTNRSSSSEADEKASLGLRSTGAAESRVATAMMGALSKGGLGRGLQFWANMSLQSAMSIEESALFGHEYLATSTRYGNTCCASCGQLDTSGLVAGTDYYAVASAQAMQSVFASGSCCWCGAAGQACGRKSGTAPMGCTACAKGRFLPRRPYGAPFWGDASIFEREISLVVADICPHQGNEAWCPHSVGSTNTFGAKNHFDFADPPPGFDNYYFAFTPTPCSAEMQQRLTRMSKCGR